MKANRNPSNIENIGENFFPECKSLCEMILESAPKLKEIGDYASSESGSTTI
jgi:hypothetical protein